MIHPASILVSSAAGVLPLFPGAGADAPDTAASSGDSEDSGHGAHLGLTDWISPSRLGRIAYARVRGYRVAAGVPRVAPENLAPVFSEFTADCRRAGLRPLHFGLPGPALEFLDAERARWHVGDLPLFDLARWREDARIPASIRTQAQRARNHGVRVRHLAFAPHAPAESDALGAAMKEWLQGKPIPPLRFLTTPFLLQPWPREGVFVAETERDGRYEVAGVLVASRALFGEVFRVDAVIRTPGAPNGCAELLVREAFRHAALQGLERATLGLAPLSRRSGVRPSGWPDRLSSLARRLGSRWYSFEGLEAFKAKFAPDAWVPLYCVAPGRRFSPRDMVAVARAFAGGSLRRYARRTLGWTFGKRIPEPRPGA